MFNEQNPDHKIEILTPKDLKKFNTLIANDAKTVIEQLNGLLLLHGKSDRRKEAETLIKDKIIAMTSTLAKSVLGKKSNLDVNETKRIIFSYLLPCLASQFVSYNNNGNYNIEGNLSSIGPILKDISASYLQTFVNFGFNSGAHDNLLNSTKRAITYGYLLTGLPTKKNIDTKNIDDKFKLVQYWDTQLFFDLPENLLSYFINVDFSTINAKEGKSIAFQNFLTQKAKFNAFKQLVLEKELKNAFKDYIENTEAAEKQAFEEITSVDSEKEAEAIDKQLAVIAFLSEALQIDKIQEHDTLEKMFFEKVEAAKIVLETNTNTENYPRITRLIQAVDLSYESITNQKLKTKLSINDELSSAIKQILQGHQSTILHQAFANTLIAKAKEFYNKPNLNIFKSTYEETAADLKLESTLTHEDLHGIAFLLKDQIERLLEDLGDETEAPYALMGLISIYINFLSLNNYQPITIKMGYTNSSNDQNALTGSYKEVKKMLNPIVTSVIEKFTSDATRNTRKALFNMMLGMVSEDLPLEGKKLQNKNCYTYLLEKFKQNKNNQEYYTQFLAISFAMHRLEPQVDTYGEIYTISFDHALSDLDNFSKQKNTLKFSKPAPSQFVKAFHAAFEVLDENNKEIFSKTILESIIKRRSTEMPVALFTIYRPILRTLMENVSQADLESIINAMLAALELKVSKFNQSPITNREHDLSSQFTMLAAFLYAMPKGKYEGLNNNLKNNLSCEKEQTGLRLQKDVKWGLRSAVTDHIIPELANLTPGSDLHRKSAKILNTLRHSDAAFDANSAGFDNGLRIIIHTAKNKNAKRTHAAEKLDKCAVKSFPKVFKQGLFSKNSPKLQGKDNKENENGFSKSYAKIHRPG